MEPTKSKLREIIQEKSYKQAPSTEEAFTLASGKKTLYYFDLKLTLLEPECFQLLGKAIWNLLEENGLTGNFDAVGGLTMGADPITFALINKAWNEKKPLYPLIVRKKPKDHGTKKVIEGHLDKCKNVLALEDVITTGGSLLLAINAFREANLNCDYAVTIVDRMEGGREMIEKSNVQLLSLFDLNDFRSS